MKRFPPVILGTVCLPWDDDYRLDTLRFRRVVRQLRTELTPYLYLFGTAGEGYAVSDRQFDEAVLAFRDEMPPGTTPMIGLISLSLPTIRERLERCLAWGISHFQISLPCWSVMSDLEVDTFFAETCGRYPQARFLHYNLMRTKRLLTGADYARLAAAHPNLVAVKTGGPTPEFVEDLLTRAPELQFFFAEPNYTRMRDRFECGLLVSLAAIHPGQARRYHAARGAELAALGAELATVRDELMVAAGEVERMDGYYDKLLLKATVPDFPLRLLPPYESPDDAVFARFMAGVPAAWRLPRP